MGDRANMLVMLCVDSASLRNPSLIGLADERLDRQSWLCCKSDSEEIRTIARTMGKQHEVWVWGSDSIDAINLAAALKHDHVLCRVVLVSFEINGSLQSRARVAHIDEVLRQSAFIERYCRYKQHAQSLPANDRALRSNTSHPSQKRTMRHDTSVSSLPVSIPYGTSETTTDSPHVQKLTNASANVASSTKNAPTYVKSIRHEQDSCCIYPSCTRTPKSVNESLYDASDRKQCISDSKRNTSAAFTLSIVGVHGGVGKSTAAVLSACLLQGMGLSTVLFDADLQFGDTHYLLGVDDPVRCDAIAQDRSRIAALRSCGNQLPAILACPERFERSEEMESHIQGMVAQLSERFDAIVINTGSAWHEHHIALVEQSTRSLVMLDQRPSAVHSCRHVLSLITRCDVASRPLVLALNRCCRGALFSASDISCAIQGITVAEIQHGGHRVDEALGMGRPLELIKSHNRLCVSLEHILSGMISDRFGSDFGASAGRDTSANDRNFSNDMPLGHKRSSDDVPFDCGSSKEHPLTRMRAAYRHLRARGGRAACL